MTIDLNAAGTGSGTTVNRASLSAILNAEFAKYQLLGGTLTANGLTLGTNTGGVTNFVLNAATGIGRNIIWETAGKIIWTLGPSGAQSGGNVGADLILGARDDAGNPLGNYATWARGTGLLTLFPPAATPVALRANGSISAVGPIQITGPGGGLVISDATIDNQLDLTFNMSGSSTALNEAILRISNSTDTCAFTGIGAGFAYPSLFVARQFGGGTVDGGRNAARFTLTQTANVPANTTDGQYVTFISFFDALGSAGGTGLVGGLSEGIGYAMYPQAVLHAGATNYNTVSVAECDIGIIATTRVLTVSGVVAGGETITATFTGSTISGSPVAVTYVTGTGNSVTSIVNGLMAAIMNNAALQAAGVSAMQTPGDVTSLNLLWKAQDTVTVTVTSTGAEVLTLGSVVGGGSSKQRRGFSITGAHNAGSQGAEDGSDFFLQFGQITTAAQSSQFRSGLQFQACMSYDGVMIEARDQIIFSTTAYNAPFLRLACDRGIDFSKVSYAKASLLLPGYMLDGTGKQWIRNANFNTDTNGLTIDIAAGKVGSGNPAIVSGGGGGAGQDANVYFVGDLVKDANGGIYKVSTVNTSTGAVTALTTVVQPYVTSGTLGAAIATTGGSGTGLTITPTGVSNYQLILLPTSGNTLKVGPSLMSANAAIATTMTSLGPAGSHTTVQEWLTVTNNAGTVRYIPCY